MDLVEIPLNKFCYRFHRLSWAEASRVVIPAQGDQRLAILTPALHDISGLPVNSVDDAMRVLRNLPEPVRKRLRVIYRGRLPDDGSFEFAGELYSAPEPNSYNRQIIAGEDAQDGTGDPLAPTGSPEERAKSEIVDWVILEPLVGKLALKRGTDFDRLPNWSRTALPQMRRCRSWSRATARSRRFTRGQGLFTVYRAIMVPRGALIDGVNPAHHQLWQLMDSPGESSLGHPVLDSSHIPDRDRKADVGTGRRSALRMARHRPT